MADMSVKLTLEVVDKATAHLKTMQAAMRGMNASQAAAGAQAAQNAQKVAQASRAAAEAVKTQAKAEKAASVAAGEANAKRMAELQRRREAYRAFEREQRIAANEARAPHWGDYWANKQAMQAEAAAAKAASAQRKVTEAVKATGNEAANTEGKLRKMARAVGNAPWGAIGTAAGAAIGRAMGKAIGDNVRSRVADALKGAWQSARGGMVGLMSDGRAGMGSAFHAARGGVNQAGVNAMSNVQGAIDIENRLRPDLGSAEAARAQRQFADQWGRSAPFHTADMRAALTELAPAGIDPRQNGLMDMLGNTAAHRADKGETMQSVARAWASVSRGDYGGLSSLGLDPKTDANGGSYVEYMVNNKMQKIALDAEKSAETMAKLQQMISTRMAGRMDDRSKSPEGLMIRMANNWNAFTSKVMDAGPFAYVTDKLKEMLGYTDQLGEGGLDALATAMGTKIKAGLIEIEAKLKSIWTSLQKGLRVLEPIVNAFGGWGNVVTMLVALPFLSYLGTLVIALGVVGSAVMMAARGFIMLGAAMMTTPLGWVIAGIAAIAAGAYLIYNNWDKIGPYFSNLWETVKTSFANWKPLEALQKAFDPVIKWVESWGKTLYDAFDGAISKVSKFVDGAWEKVSKVWEKVQGAVKSVGSWVGGGGDTPADKTQQAITQGQQANEGIKNLTRLKELFEEVQAAAAVFSLLPALQTAIGAAESYLAGVSFYSHGAAMMETLAQGMRAKAEAAVAAVRDVTQRMRDHLPHSPAKVGPLSDLHQIKFSETLAMGIHAGPAVAAVQNVVGQMRSAVTPVGISTVRGSGGAGGDDAVGGGGGRGATTIHYAPTVNGSGLDRQQLLDVLRQSAHDALQILDGQRRDNDRLAFS